MKSKCFLSMALFCCCCCLFGCQRENDAVHNKPKRPPVLPDDGSVQLVFQKMEDRATQKAIFKFKNVGNKLIDMDGFGAPLSGRFHPSFVQYEAMEQEKWEPVPVWYDGDAESYRFDPEDECLFVVDLRAYERHERPLLCRIKVNDRYYSREFILR